MKKNIVKYLIISLVTVLLFSGIAKAALLSDNTLKSLNDNTTLVQEGAGYDANTTVGSVVAMVIKAFLALLGVIFVILLIVAGFNWMTAAGDEEKINKAKDTIKAAVIGLIIIAASYSITYFIFENLPGSGGGGL